MALIDLAIRASVYVPALQKDYKVLRIDHCAENRLYMGTLHSDPEGKVWVEVSRTEGETIIRVRDQGQGIAKEHLSRLFERFYRVDRARSKQQGGTGLGLAIVKHIIEAHGGHLTVESELGKGSTFAIHLCGA